ncbi:MAG: hypothetical protein RL748_1517, partial [Pseudomonadota bacterium]
MYFTEQPDPKASMTRSMPRMMLVALLHVVVFFLIAQSMGIRMVSKPHDTVTTVDAIPEPTPVPTPPPTTDTLMPKETPVTPPWIAPPDLPIDPPPAGPSITGVKGDPPKDPYHPGPHGTPTPTLPPTVIARHEPVRVKAVIDASACSKPEYPKNSIRNEEEGTVVLGFLVGVDGRVMDSRIEKTSGYKDLDKAARQGLSLCRFKPGTVDGVPQEA